MYKQKNISVVGCWQINILTKQYKCGLTKNDFAYLFFYSLNV